MVVFWVGVDGSQRRLTIVYCLFLYFVFKVCCFCFCFCFFFFCVRFCFCQLMSVNDGRLRRLSNTAGIAGGDADPWARCRGPGGGVPAGGQGVRLRNYIRRLQLEKSVGESQVREVIPRVPFCLAEAVVPQCVHVVQYFEVCPRKKAKVPFLRAVDVYYKNKSTPQL